MNKTRRNLFSDNVAINLNVFGSFMESRIDCDILKQIDYHNRDLQACYVEFWDHVEDKPAIISHK